MNHSSHELELIGKLLHFLQVLLFLQIARFVLLFKRLYPLLQCLNFGKSAHDTLLEVFDNILQVLLLLLELHLFGLDLSYQLVLLLGGFNKIHFLRLECLNAHRLTTNHRLCFLDLILIAHESRLVTLTVHHLCRKLSA